MENVVFVKVILDESDVGNGFYWEDVDGDDCFIDMVIFGVWWCG